MSSKANPGHQPERFQVYTQLPNKKGFTINNSTHVFYFNKHGGFYDQFHNYYNDMGEPSDPVSDEDEEYSDHEDTYAKPAHHHYYDDEEDQFQNEFGKPKDLSDDQEDTHGINIKHYEAIASNSLALNNYPTNAPLRVHFRNLSYFTRKEQALKSYGERTKGGVLNVIFNLNDRGQSKGSGYFVVKNVEVAECLIKLEGEKVTEREAFFQVEDIESFLLDPIKQSQLKDTNHHHHKTADIVIGKKHEEKKVYEQKGKAEQKVEPRKEVKVEAKEQIRPAFKWYKFVRKAFPKKSSFKEWMIEHKFIENVDFKNAEKIEGDNQMAKIEMKEEIFKQLNGKQYQGVKVYFQPL